MNNREVAKKTQVIAIGNQKGGVGKTTTTTHLAAALGTLGRKSLIIDLDANCGATHSFGIPPDSFQGTYEVLIGVESPLDVALQTDPDEGVTLPDGVDLIPANRELERIDVELANKHKFTDYRDCLRQPLQQVCDSGKYDYVFLDTAPNIATPTVAAYRVADWFILTATPENLAIKGLNDAMSDIQTVQENTNRDLKLLGCLLSCVDRRTRLANELIRWVEDTFEAAKNYGDFATRIGRTVKVPEAQGFGQTLFQYDPAHQVAEQYRQLAREVEERIARFMDATKPEVTITDATVPAPPSPQSEAVTDG